MAGHRRTRGAPKRSASAAQAMRERLAAAPTDEARLAVAFDWFRSAASKDGKRRDSAGCGLVAVREATAYLAREAAQLEGSTR